MVDTKFKSLDDLLDHFSGPAETKRVDRNRKDNPKPDSWTNPNGGPPPTSPMSSSIQFLASDVELSINGTQGIIGLIKHNIPCNCYKHFTWKLVGTNTPGIMQVNVKFFCWG